MILFTNVCVCAFSLHRESPGRILGDKPLLFKGVLSQTDTVNFVYVVYLVSLVFISSMRCQFWDKHLAHHFIFHQLCIQAVYLVNIDSWFRYNLFFWNVMQIDHVMLKLLICLVVIFGGMKYNLIWTDWNWYCQFCLCCLFDHFNFCIKYEMSVLR
jgi:hypothetical protein